MTDWNLLYRTAAVEREAARRRVELGLWWYEPLPPDEQAAYDKAWERAVKED